MVKMIIMLDCVKAKGLWNYEENRCYRYYVKSIFISGFEIFMFNRKPRY